MTVSEAPRPQGTIGVKVVQRNDDAVRAGQGMWRGMGRVMTHFVRSFTRKNDSKDDIHGMFTVQYPEERVRLPEAFRNFPILLYDDATGQELCTSCFQCERVCPPQVIHMTQAKDPRTGKPVPAVEQFVIEYDSCMSCGFCAEVCPFEAIKMDHVYELSTPDHLSMDLNKAALDRPVSYYEAIAPAMWAAVQENALKKLANNVKRRTGTIGIAPQMIGKVPEREAPEPPRPAAVAPTPRAPVVEAPPAAKPAAAMPADKAARLEAIRAAKRAAAGGDGSAADAPAPPAPAPERAATGANMAADKAARLEAIRAAKRAAAAGGTGEASAAADGTSEAPAVPESPNPAPAATGTNMPTDKAARLEAIRAAKRAAAAAPTSGAPPVEAPSPPSVPAEPAAVDAPPPIEARSPAPDGASMSGDKAARLAAIRAANRAKKGEE